MKIVALSNSAKKRRLTPSGAGVHSDVGPTLMGGKEEEGEYA
jgi:hypothetical protein